MTRQRFWQTIKKYGKQIGINLSPHTLRHSFLHTHCLKAKQICALFRKCSADSGHIHNADIYQGLNRQNKEGIYRASSKGIIANSLSNVGVSAATLFVC